MRVQRADGTWIEIGEGGDQIYTWNAPSGEQWHWSIVAATAFAHARNEIRSISLADMDMTLGLLLRLYPDINVEYALTTDVSQPLLFVPLEEKVRLIDGSHRVCKALLTGIDILPAYFLTQEEADQSLVARLPRFAGVEWNQAHRNAPALPASVKQPARFRQIVRRK